MNTITIDKKRYVLIPEAEYKLLNKGRPSLPPKNKDGTYPAVAAMQAMIGQGLIRDREAVGMTQKDLAEAAGIRVEVLNRAERGVTVPSIRTLAKIDQALSRVGVKRPARGK